MANDNTVSLTNSQNNSAQAEYFEECVKIPKTLKQHHSQVQLLNECDEVIERKGETISSDEDICSNVKLAQMDLEGNCSIDKDGDGVHDVQDNCPENTPLEISKGVDLHGCPLDSDQDTVFDYQDKCLNTQFTRAVDEQGCPIVMTEMPQPVQTDILFAFDSAVLKPNGKLILDDILNKVVNKAGSHEFIKHIQIVGHTDSTGTEEYNQQLSDNRARSVANYLIEKGLSIEKITAKGEGELKPAVPNDTRENRAQNRRVVITITWFKSKLELPKK